MARVLNIDVTQLMDTGTLSITNAMLELFSDGITEIQKSPEEKALKSSLDFNFTQLNLKGQRKVVDFSEDIFKIPEYRKDTND